jgi:hypothetical protein
MKSGYKQMIKGLERKAYSASLTPGVILLSLFSLLLLGLAIAYAFLQKHNQSLLPLFVISLAVGGLGFFGALAWYLMKAREYMRAESVELDARYPGFYDYYQEYQSKVNDVVSSSNYYQ